MFLVALRITLFNDSIALVREDGFSDLRWIIKEGDPIIPVVTSGFADLGILGIPGSGKVIQRR